MVYHILWVTHVNHRICVIVQNVYVYFLQDAVEFKSGPTGSKGHQVDICLVVIRLTVFFYRSILAESCRWSQCENTGLLW